jgi:hypothetical protein
MSNTSTEITLYLVTNIGLVYLRSPYIYPYLTGLGIGVGVTSIVWWIRYNFVNEDEEEIVILLQEMGLTRTVEEIGTINEEINLGHYRDAVAKCRIAAEVFFKELLDQLQVPYGPNDSLSKLIDHLQQYTDLQTLAQVPAYAQNRQAHLKQKVFDILKYVREVLPPLVNDAAHGQTNPIDPTKEEAKQLRQLLVSYLVSILVFFPTP